MKKDGRKFYINLKNVRTEEQRRVMEQIERDAVCPFCPEHFLNYHTKPLLLENSQWLLTENFAPYEGSRHHFLLVAKRHIESFCELTHEEQVAFFEILKQCKSTYQLTGGSIVLRWGDTRLTGGSVAHLHAHLIVGGTGEINSDKLYVRVGYKK